MSQLKYFKKSEKASALDPCNVCKSMKNDLPNNITANKLEKVKESLKVVWEEKKKINCLCQERQAKIATYVPICGVTAPRKFPNLTKSIMRPRLKTHKKSIQDRRREEPVCNQQLEELEDDHCLEELEDVLNFKLHSMLVNLQTAGAGLWCTKWLDSCKLRKVRQVYGS